MPGTIYGDEKRLHQIMVNIANNAIKFTDEEGTVTLRLYPPDGAGGPATELGDGMLGHRARGHRGG
ncbi:MAG: ATP-binding protein [Trueperaceae bacterium]|nr:ATP-binding protein [Trueperaceae bacterium]